MRTALIALLLVSASTVAQDIDVSVDDSSTSIYSDSSNRGYESSTGNRYEYDLSNPGDRVRYDVDVGAQMRDEMSVSPTREIDRDLGQYGGGIYD
jgi:putative salt-induced outer membrane protein YdiY